jgi:hypothetical protein
LIYLLRGRVLLGWLLTKSAHAALYQTNFVEADVKKHRIRQETLAATPSDAVGIIRRNYAPKRSPKGTLTRLLRNWAILHNNTQSLAFVPRQHSAQKYHEKSRLGCLSIDHVCRMCADPNFRAR